MKTMIFLVTNFLLLFQGLYSGNNKASSKEINKPIKGYFYLGLGATSGTSSNFPHKAISLGYQSKIFKKNAIQISSMCTNKTLLAGAHDIEVYFPRLNYLTYFDKESKSSYYYGLGGFIGIISPFTFNIRDNITYETKTLFPDAFTGIGSIFSIGYNTSLYSESLNAFQLDCNFPILHFESRDDTEKLSTELFNHLDYITFSLSYNIGF